MTPRHLGCLAVCLLGCSGDDVVDPCDFDAEVVIEARAAPLTSDGAVTLSGSVRFAPLAGETAPGAVTERAVHAVYVAEQEVLPAAGEFNFRTWSITLMADRLAIFTTTEEDGSKRARLPVRAYLQGRCVVELPEPEQPVVEIAASSIPLGD